MKWVGHKAFTREMRNPDMLIRKCKRKRPLERPRNIQTSTACS